MRNSACTFALKLYHVNASDPSHHRLRQDYILYTKVVLHAASAQQISSTMLSTQAIAKPVTMFYA